MSRDVRTRALKHVKLLARTSIKRVPMLVVALIVLSAHAQRTATPEPPDLSTDTRSTVFTTAEERLKFLVRYLNFPTRPEDAQYHLVYFDNS